MPPLIIPCRDQLLIPLPCHDMALLIYDISSLPKAADNIFTKYYVELKVDIVGHFVEQQFRVP
jgi:hypothetical protein